MTWSGFAAAARQIASKLAPTPFGQKQIASKPAPAPFGQRQKQIASKPAATPFGQRQIASKLAATPLRAEADAGGGEICFWPEAVGAIGGYDGRDGLRSGPENGPHGLGSAGRRCEGLNMTRICKSELVREGVVPDVRHRLGSPTSCLLQVAVVSYRLPGVQSGKTKDQYVQVTDAVRLRGAP